MLWARPPSSRLRRKRIDLLVGVSLDLYGHLFADQLDEVADAMDAARALAQGRADFVRTNGADVSRLSGENKSRAQ